MTQPAYPHYLTFPFRIGEDGRTARIQDLREHVSQELKQLILTNLGERLFQPDIGTNIRRLVFENIDASTKGMTKATVTRALGNWLGHRVIVEELQVESDDSMLTVIIRYRVAGTEDSRTLRFQRSEL